MKGTYLEARCAMKHALGETSTPVAAPDSMSSSRCCRKHRQESEEAM